MQQSRAMNNQNRHAKTRWTGTLWAFLSLQLIFGHPSNGYTQSQVCELYPIALSWSSLSNIATGAVLNDLREGVQPGNFGWLSWSGKNGNKTLVNSLTPPGDSSTAYQDPDDPRDRIVNLDDWVSAMSASNSKD